MCIRDSTEGAPKFTIKEQNADGGWDNVLEVDLVEGNTGASGEWTETTGTWVNENVNNYKIQVYKNGVANAGLAQNLHLDSFSFVYSEAASSGVSTFPYCTTFDNDLGDWTSELISGSGSSVPWNVSATNYNGSVTPQNGAGMAFMYDNSAVANLTSTAMDISGLTNPQLTFSYTQPTWAGDQDELSCLLYTSPSPRDLSTSRMPSSA